MSIERRMKDVLSEASRVKAGLGTEEGDRTAEALAESRDINVRAAQILAAGLRSDLPDDPDTALDYLVDVIRNLSKQKQYLAKALRFTSNPSQVKAVLTKIQRGL